MAKLNVGTQRAGRVAQIVPSKYFKLSPSTSRYQRLQKISEQRQCSLEDVVRLALDFYLEFQEKKIIVVAPR